jgi:hypothetical protein
LTEVVGDIPKTLLDDTSIVDGIWLLIAVVILCLDSLGKLIAIAICGWQETLKKKNEQTR